MSNLIEKQAAIEAVVNGLSIKPSETIVRAIIETIPAADVKPVVKSYWTTKRTEQHDGEWYCANCGYEPIVFDGSRYCPNCGARMDGKE